MDESLRRPSVVVVTPTTGEPELIDALISVENQDYDGELVHFLVVDGPEFWGKVDAILQKTGYSPMVLKLPFNTGKGGWYGHRIFASVPMFLEFDYVSFLDQDNWFALDHISSLVDIAEKHKWDWAYSLRNIYNKNGNFVIQDNCESLGEWPAWFSEDVHLIDTSCYLYKKEFIQTYCHLWRNKWGADRYFYHAIKNVLKHKNYGTSGKYTLSYRLGGNDGSVSQDFFIEGNLAQSNKYGVEFPWTFSDKGQINE